MTDIKRPHYFKGQFLTADDFIAEQQYHIEMRRLHNSTMHTWGVIEGLVVIADAALVKVSAGMAIDKEGREIRLLKQTSLPIPQATANGTYLVVISYKEEFDKESPYPPASPSDPEESRYIRKVETGELSWAVTTTANEDDLLHLAHVNISGGRVTGQLTTVKRRNASSRISRRSILGDNDLTIGPNGNIGIGTTEPGARFEIRGDKTQPNPTEQDGLNASTVLYVGGGKGGNTIGSGRKAGAGASITLRAGEGGDAIAGSTSGDGGSISLSPGKAGAGAGSRGKTGSVRLAPEGGNVGIGVTDPQSALEVKGDVVIQSLLSFSDGNGNRYRDNWIGMANNIDRATKWLHIGGITDEGARRLALMADRTYVSGNVGIGTTAPGAKLEINGGLLLKSASGQLGLWDTNASADKGRFYFWNTGGGVYGRWVNDDNSAIVAHNILFKNNGNVGIGTIDPGFTLQVGDHLNVKDSRLCIAGKGETGNYRRWTLRTGDKDKATGAARAAEIHKLRIRDEEAGADRLVIDEDGRVGIGTTSPNSDLVICKSAMNAIGPVLTLFNNGGGADAGGAIDFKGYDYEGKSDTTARIRSISDGIYSSHLAFYAKEYSTETSKPLKEIMRLQSDGKVGIGTANPEGQLEIANPTSGVKVKFGGTDGDVHHLSSSRDLVLNSANGTFLFRKIDSYSSLKPFTDQMTINGDGDVTVKGRIACGGYIALKTFHNTYVAADGNKTLMRQNPTRENHEQFIIQMACSREFKENISDISVEEAMTTLEALNPIKYDYKDGKAFRQNLGFIAEEMPNNLASEDRKSISPFEVIPVLTKVTKEQQKSIAHLQEIVRALREEVRRHNIINGAEASEFF